MYKAKSTGTSIEKHTGNVLRAVKHLRKHNSLTLPDSWWNAVEHSAFLHDIGKIDPEFQEMLERREVAPIPHGLFSLFLIQPNNIDMDEDTISIILSSVAFHHWRSHFSELFLGNRSSEISNRVKELLKNWSDLDERVQKLKIKMEELAKEHGLNLDIISVNEFLLEDLENNGLGSTGLLIPPYTMAFLPSRIKKESEDLERLRIFVSGSLMRADHFASYAEESSGKIKPEDIEAGAYLKDVEINKSLIKVLGQKTFWQKEFLDNNSLKRENLILVAPTGVGKTEFAYLWGAGKKNITMLPMQAAVNGIWKRTVNLFETLEKGCTKDVAIMHGNASLELFKKNKENKTEHELEGKIRQSLEIARHFAKPYIVCTADQIVPAALRYPGFERIYASLMDSCLIIDEVQAYDPRAAAIVTHLIQQNNFLGGKTLLMTATLPAFIKEEVVKRVNLSKESIIKLLERPEFDWLTDSKRHHIKMDTHKGDYKQFVDEAIEKANDGKKVLVVLNTKKTALKFYNAVKNKRPDSILLHSRFTNRDRQEKEAAVYELMPNKKERNKEGCIVISTQVVEASLDLDADILFTDAAPSDSLIQRMGRVFRRFARTSGDNFPDYANVVIMINIPEGEKEEKVKKSYLAPGIGAIKSAKSNAVYDFDLTMVSLVALLAAVEEPGNLEPEKMRKLIKDKYINCFKLKGKGSHEKQTKNLKKFINKKSLVLNEKQKLQWVDTCYQLMFESFRSELDVDLGNYLNSYYETLEMLDYGYCSDKKQDAQRLFRDVSDVSIIPKEKVESFYEAVAKLIQSKNSGLSFMNLSNNIFPCYLVNCPWYKAQKAEELDINLILEKVSVSEKTKEKLSRWLTGIYVLDKPYNQSEGLKD